MEEISDVGFSYRRGADVAHGVEGPPRGQAQHGRRGGQGVSSFGASSRGVRPQGTHGLRTRARLHRRNSGQAGGDSRQVAK